MVRIAFEGYLGIGPGASEVLVALFDADGKPLQARDICRQVSSHRPLRMGTLHERISVLRRAMDTEAVDSDAGTYSLTEIGLAECQTALKVMADIMVGERDASQPQRNPAQTKRQTSHGLQMRLFEMAG